MDNLSKIFVLVFAFLGTIGIAACGSESDPAASSVSSASTVESVTTQDSDGDKEKEDDHDDDKKSGLSAHEHGAAELTVAWTEDSVVIDLISPTQNIFGFENEATTEEEKTVVEDRTKALTAPGIVAINDEAGCELDGDASTELEYEGSHAEITASWEYTCDNPDEISQLETAELFNEFPKLEDLDVQWASEAGQSSAELTPDSTRLALS